MMTNKSTTIRIRFVDLKNNPFPNLYHEIRVSGNKYAISAGHSDSKGLGVHISRPVGTQLDILVKHPITKKMINANHKVTVTIPVNKGIFRVQAPFYIQTTKLKLNNENGGNYRRKTHKVKPGETLISIAKRFDTTWQVIYQLNRDVVRGRDTIHVGDILKIPPENSGLRGQSNNNVNSTSTTEYTLKKGDTLWDISQDTGIPVSELKRINNISDPTTLQTGQTIKLRDNSSAKPQSTPTPSKPEKNTDVPSPVETKKTDTSSKDGTPKTNSSKLGDCSCNRDLTISELKEIFQTLQIQNSDPLFGHSKCILNPSERNFESFLLYLNKTFNKYDINTCLRRIHFLAQAHHESAYFTTTTEFGNGSKYEPYYSSGNKNLNAIKNGNTQRGDGAKYKGRGLIQLTWKNNYKLYKSYSGLDVVSNPTLIDESLDLSCDVSGWFWKQGKVFSDSPIWRGPSKRPAFIADEHIDYPKTRIIEGNVTYGAVDMNIIADDDNVTLLTYLINGGNNGIEHRRTNVILLKTLFDYPSKCISTGIQKPVVQENSEDLAPWMEIAIREAKQWKDKPENVIDDIDNYFKLINFTRPGYNAMSTSSQAWCAAFVGYCLQETGYKKISGTGDSYDLIRANGFRLDKVNFKRIEEPIYGAIACYMKRPNHSSHVALVIATHPNGTHFYRLGGNQAQHLSIDVRPIVQYEFYVPTTYLPLAKTQGKATQKSEDDIKALEITWHGWKAGSTR